MTITPTAPPTEAAPTAFRLSSPPTRTALTTWTTTDLIAELAAQSHRQVAEEAAYWQTADQDTAADRWQAADFASETQTLVVGELIARRADWQPCDGCAIPTGYGHTPDCTIRPFTHPTGPASAADSPIDLPAACDIAAADIVSLFAGPGGACTGASILGIPAHRIIGVDLSQHAVATARAAGYPRITASIRDLDPADFTHMTGAIITPPCPTWTGAGKQTARQDMELLREAIYCISGRCGCIWRTLPHRTTEPGTALSIEPLLWALSLPNLQWLVCELTPAAATLWEEFAHELTTAEERQEWGAWAHAEVVILDAADYGAGARRTRAFLIARRYSRISVRPETPAGVFPSPTMAQALGWPAGRVIRTRGNRKTSGGNLIHADRGPSLCLTSRARGWTLDGATELDRNGNPIPAKALTIQEAGLLQGFPRDFSWQGPSRTAIFQQIGDIVSPMVAAAVIGAATNTEWVRPVRAHLSRIYP